LLKTFENEVLPKHYLQVQMWFNK